MGTARDENVLNIFLEFVPGGSIASLLNKFGPFPELVKRKRRLTYMAHTNDDTGVEHGFAF